MAWVWGRVTQGTQSRQWKSSEGRHVTHWFLSVWPGSACQESAGVGCRTKTNLGSVGLGRVSRVGRRQGPEF